MHKRLIIPVPYGSICYTYHQLKYSSPNRSDKPKDKSHTREPNFRKMACQRIAIRLISGGRVTYLLDKGVTDQQTDRWTDRQTENLIPIHPPSPYFYFFIFSNCQAHHCGAFIPITYIRQLHSFILSFTTWPPNFVMRGVGGGGV